MKKKTLKRSNTRATSRSNNQRGFIKNWFRGMNRNGKQRVKLIFVIGVALIGTYLVTSSFAAAKPRYFGNADYWIVRVIACETGQGIWGQGDYEAKGEGSRSGAFNYNIKEWNNFGGFSEARLAPAVVQNDKFTTDWNDPATGSTRWKSTMECWKPAGTIKGAPCLPVPKNPTNEEINRFQLDQVIEDPDAIDYCCDEEFGYPEVPEEAHGHDE